MRHLAPLPNASPTLSTVGVGDYLHGGRRVRQRPPAVTVTRGDPPAGGETACGRSLKLRPTVEARLSRAPRGSDSFHRALHSFYTHQLPNFRASSMLEESIIEYADATTGAPSAGFLRGRGRRRPSAADGPLSFGSTSRGMIEAHAVATPGPQERLLAAARPPPATHEWNWNTGNTHTRTVMSNLLPVGLALKGSPRGGSPYGNPQCAPHAERVWRERIPNIRIPCCSGPETSMESNLSPVDEPL